MVQSPWCAVQGPTAVPGVYRNVWAGPLTPEIGKSLLGSPFRDRLATLMLNSTSVLWIYLDSGVAAADDANFALLEAERIPSRNAPASRRRPSQALLSLS